MVRIEPKYTEVLLNLMENAQTKPLLDKALSTYPMYVSTIKHEYIPNIIPTRSELNKKLLNYYKYREIGFETVGRFLDELEIAMNEIMPYYNQLFFTQDQDFNVIYNVDYVRTTDRNREQGTESKAITSTEGSENVQATSENSATTTNENYNKNVKSDTPQNSLSITNKNIDNVDYASEVGWNHDSNTETLESEGSNNTTSNVESTGTSTATGDLDEKEQTVETTKGNFGVVSAQDLIEKYRKIILNVEQQIINDPRIKELFMNVY